MDLFKFLDQYGKEIRRFEIFRVNTVMPWNSIQYDFFVCDAVLQPSQLIRVMSRVASLHTCNHIFSWADLVL